MKTGLINPSIY